MADYRLYYFNEGDHIIHWHGFSAADDGTAVAMAEDAARGLRMELWCGARKVRAWDEPVKK